MIFTNNNPRSNNLYEVGAAKRQARRKALIHRFTSREELLSSALQKHFGLNLRSCCALLVDHATYSRNFSHQILISFINPAHDTLAKVITYGIDGIEGSSILHEIFEGR